MSGKKLIVLVEGNIASGKTTFLKKLESKFKDSALITFEPLDQWTNFKGKNMLKELYTDPKRFSFQFQTFVQLTMAKIQTTQTTKPFKFSERSLYSERFVFIEALKILQHISQTEYDILIEWFDYLVQKVPPVDQIIYLRTTPEIAYQRLIKRSRNEENSVQLDYIELIHSLHEQWLIEGKDFFTKNVKVPVLKVVDQDKNLDELESEFEQMAETFMFDYENKEK